jgi:hypothetical protein
MQTRPASLRFKGHQDGKYITEAPDVGQLNHKPCLKPIKPSKDSDEEKKFEDEMKTHGVLHNIW